MQGTAVTPERNNAAGGEAESLFSLALNARCEFATMWLYVTSGDAGAPAFARHRGMAYDCACRAGYHYAHEPIPHLLRDDDELRLAWTHGVINRRRDHIRKLIAANDWPALDLPFPEKILETLRAGKPVHVDGHGLYSEEDSICCVSPYGIERVVCAARDLSLADIEGFLADMALDVEWDAVPH
ncbi:MAG: hypothetical protein EPN45_23165 [Rhizobiaceae bacterium]|nr:MAG: hypothetical protein EPN45_23165 [Rhizobiaceae bacterium]